MGKSEIVNMSPNENASSDAGIEKVYDALKPYRAEHAQAQIKAKRQNPLSIRLRIVDPDFNGMDRVEREAKIWPLLETLPDEVFSDLTMLLLLTPPETKDSFANMEFEHPVESQL